MNDEHKIQNLREVDKQRWANFSKLLKEYKQNLGATDVELSNGLHISEDKIKDFLSDKQPKRSQRDYPTLGVDRWQLISLWMLLKKSNEHKDKSGQKRSTNKKTRQRKFSEEEIKAREELSNNGPDDMLRMLGFLPHKNKPLEAAVGRRRQIERLVTMLEPHALDEQRFNSLVDIMQSMASLISEVLEKKGGKFSSPSSSVQLSSYNREEALELSQDLSIHITDEIHTNTIRERFLRALEIYEQKGIKRFERIELVKLYDSISHKVLEDRLPYLEIRSCQFKHPSFDLNLDPSFTNEVKEYTIKGKDLVQAEVICELNYLDIDEPYKAEMSMKYTSAFTHLGNLLMCITHGLGTEWQLGGMELKVKSLGNAVSSLAECRAALWKIEQLDSTPSEHKSEGKKEAPLIQYTGQWVSDDLIVGAAQAMIIAVEDWLRKSIGTVFSSGLLEHYKRIVKANELKNQLSFSHVYDYGFLKMGANHEEQGLDQELLQELLKERQELSALKMPVYDFHITGYSRIYCVYKIQQARKANIIGDWKAAIAILKDVQLVRYIGSWNPGDAPLGEQKDKLKPVRWLYDSERLLLLLSSPESSEDENFSKSLEIFWKHNDFDSVAVIDDRGDAHINSSPRDYYRFPGRDTYISITELCGNYGRLKFYLAPEGDLETLREARKFFTVAAHFASKLGYRRRTARWLTIAARTRTRLGDFDGACTLLARAQQLLEPEVSVLGRPAALPMTNEGGAVENLCPESGLVALGDLLLVRINGRVAAHEAMKVSQKDLEDHAFCSETGLAWGDLALLSGFSLQAVRLFVSSLAGGLHLGFYRRCLDSIYGISKALQPLEGTDRTIALDLIKEFVCNELPKLSSEAEQEGPMQILIALLKSDDLLELLGPSSTTQNPWVARLDLQNARLNSMIESGKFLWSVSDVAH